MIVTYFIISAPAITMELVISTQDDLFARTMTFIMAVSIPCLIAILQKDNEKIRYRRKAVFTAIILLAVIMALVIAYISGKDFNNSNYFSEMVTVLLVIAIPTYVKSTFKNIIELENEDIAKLEKAESDNTESKENDTKKVSSKEELHPMQVERYTIFGGSVKSIDFYKSTNDANLLFSEIFLIFYRKLIDILPR